MRLFGSEHELFKTVNTFIKFLPSFQGSFIFHPIFFIYPKNLPGQSLIWPLYALGCEFSPSGEPCICAGEVLSS